MGKHGISNTVGLIEFCIGLNVKINVHFIITVTEANNIY